MKWRTGWTYSTHGKIRNEYKNLVGKHEEKRTHGRVGVDGRIVLEK
jgi:hypothetical protein